LISILQSGLKRCLATLVAERLRQFPAVTLIGPPQCGKTTLARSLGRTYFNLEDPDERVRLDATWSTATAAAGLTVLDEAQNWPELFSRLRGVIDDDRKRNGRFLLLGSVSPDFGVSPTYDPPNGPVHHAIHCDRKRKAQRA